MDSETKQAIKVIARALALDALMKFIRVEEVRSIEGVACDKLREALAILDEMEKKA